MIQNNERVETQKFVFFIGAGFTKAIVNTAPIGTEFFIKAFDTKKPFIHNENVKRVKNFIETIYYPLGGFYPRIEDVLSLIDYVIQKKDALSKEYLFEDVVSIRNDLIYLIGKVIKYCLEEEPIKPRLDLTQEFIEKIKKLSGIITSENINNDANKNISIISTNYDIIIDNALLEELQSCNYGGKLRYNIYLEGNSSNKPNAKRSWEFWSPRGSHNGQINQGIIPLLKIHGSLNWLYCPKCNELDITIGEKGAIFPNGYQSEFLCTNPYCTSNYTPLLVTPTMIKVYDNSFLQKLWTLSEKIISESDKLIFIGYSLSEADYHIRSLLTKSLVKINKYRQILVIEKDPKNKKEKEWSQYVKERYDMLFGKDIVDFQAIGLEGFLRNWEDILKINV